MIWIDMEKLRKQAAWIASNDPPKFVAELLMLAESVLQANDDNPGDVIKVRANTLHAQFKDKTMYNHMFDVGFSIETEQKDPTKIIHNELIAALTKRLETLKANPDEEAFGHCDTYKVPNE